MRGIKQMKNGANTISAEEERNTDAADVTSGELHALTAEVVDILYTQTVSPAEIGTEKAVCKAFSNILLRHWDLCCIITFLQSEDGHLRESAIHITENLAEMPARRAGALLAEAAERTGREQQVWLGEGDNQIETDVGRALAAAGLKAGVAVPIHARGALVGALVAITAFPERLRAALRGVRFIAAPIVIAVGNARRAAAMCEQRARIEQLVEELRRRGAELEEANSELQRVARYRSLFLARMSHELRTPLTSILGFAEILLEHEDLTETQQRFCGKIQGSGLQLKTSLNQLVDLSRLEAGQTEIFLHEFSLREMLRESCAAVGRLAQKQGVKVDCCSATEIGAIVSDEGKLRQVLYNFIAHAISRSPEGERVAVHASIPAPSLLLIEIRDQGAPLLDPAHIFDPVDVDAPNESGTNMNELGLVIAHRLIDVLGGTVTLKADATSGLTVRLEFPTRPVERK